MKNIKWLSITSLIIILTLSGCSKKEKPYEEMPVGALYNIAMQHVAEEDFHSALSSFEEVERQHPYSEWATKSLLMAAYSAYQIHDYDEAILKLNSFLMLHPVHKYADYAVYLMGMSYYQQISYVDRDQEISVQAKGVFNDLRKKFPDSPYARDVEQRLLLIDDHLAAHDLEVGRYYQKENMPYGAAIRYERVVKNHERTEHAQEALYRLSEVYLSLGIRDLAVKAGAVLGHNHPNSLWYKRAYELLAKHNNEPKNIVFNPLSEQVLESAPLALPKLDLSANTK